MLFFILFLVIGIIVSFLFLKDGSKESYIDINSKVNTEYYRNFRDWRLEFEKIETSKTKGNNEINPDEVNFNILSAHDKKNAELLGLEQNFNSEQLKKAFLRKIKENHPDKFSSDPKKFQKQNEICVNINSAYTYLKGKYF